MHHPSSCRETVWLCLTCAAQLPCFHSGLEELVGDTRAKLEALRAASGEATGDASSKEKLADAFRDKNLSAEDIPVTPEEAMQWMEVWADAQVEAAAGEVLPNVLEAQRWIAAWRETQDKGVLPNVLEAQRWIAAWRENQGEDEVLPNVLEAQRWISAWRDAQGKKDEILPNVLEAQRWIAAWREGQQTDEILPNVLEAQRWISAWRGTHGKEDEVLPNVLEAQRWISAWREVQKTDEILPNVMEAQRWISSWREAHGKEDEVLPNVLEAQRWIAAWRGAQGDEGVPSNVLDAQRWISAWRESRAVAEKEEWKAKLAAWMESHSSGQEVWGGPLRSPVPFAVFRCISCLSLHDDDDDDDDDDDSDDGDDDDDDDDDEWDFRVPLHLMPLCLIRTLTIIVAPSAFVSLSLRRRPGPCRLPRKKLWRSRLRRLRAAASWSSRAELRRSWTFDAAPSPTQSRASRV